MEYITLIQKFWKLNEENPMNATLLVLYLFLLETWYQKEQKDFELSDAYIAKRLKINRNTIKYNKKELRDLGLISYQITSGLPTFYKIIIDYSINRKAVNISKEKETKKVIENQLKTKQEKSLQKVISHEIITQEKPIAEQKNTTFNNEILLQNTAVEQVVPPKIIEKPIEKPTLSDAHSILKNKNIPSLEEFMEYAKTIEIYNENLDFSIKSKYETWLENGWVTGLNKPITNWKQTLRNTMPYMASNSLPKPKNILSIPKITRPKATYNE